MKTTFFTLMVIMMVLPFNAQSDTLEYLKGDELVVVMNLLKVEVKENSYSYIDMSDGYACKKHVKIGQSIKNKVRVIPSSDKTNKDALNTYLNKMWDGSIILESGAQIDATGLGITYSLASKKQRNQVHPIIKDRMITIKNTSNQIQSIQVDEIHKILFFENGLGVSITLKNNKTITGALPCVQESQKIDKLILTGIRKDNWEYFEVSIQNVKMIKATPINPDLVCDYKR